MLLARVTSRLVLVTALLCAETPECMAQTFVLRDFRATPDSTLASASWPWVMPDSLVVQAVTLRCRLFGAHGITAPRDTVTDGVQSRPGSPARMWKCTPGVTDDNQDDLWRSRLALLRATRVPWTGRGAGSTAVFLSATFYGMDQFVIEEVTWRRTVSSSGVGDPWRLISYRTEITR